VRGFSTFAFYREKVWSKVSRLLPRSPAPRRDELLKHRDENTPASMRSLVASLLLWSSASALLCGQLLTPNAPLAVRVRMQAAGSLRAEIAEKMLEPFRNGGQIGIYALAVKKMKPAFATADADGDRRVSPQPEPVHSPQASATRRHLRPRPRAAHDG